MFAFGCAIIATDIYERHARVGLERAAEPGSAVFAHAASGSVARSYNLMFDRAARLSDLEALVLVHDDAEIVDPAFCEKLRSVFSDPDVGVVGCVGARGVGDIAWWDGELRWSSATYRYGELGGGELHIPADIAAAPGEVDSVYGLMMAFSPWVVRNLRFDESLGVLYGYDFDICRQVRQAGRKVVAADLGVAHHHSLDLIEEIEIWTAAHMRAAELWGDSGPEDPDDPAWEVRARRAEAAAAAAHLLLATELLRLDAHVRQCADQQEAIERSRSWRLTASLRQTNAFRRSAAQRIRRRSGGAAST